MIVDNDLLSIQQARILAEDASIAQQKLASFSQEQLDNILERVAEELEKQSKDLAIMAHEETDYGKWQDKWLKNQFVCRYVRQHLKGMRCVGIIHEDHAKRTMDIGVPLGILVALCPVTSPVSTTIYKSLLAIKTGNPIIFSPHPRAFQTIRRTLDTIIRVAESSGLPKGSISYLSIISKSGTKELMKHPNTARVLITGDSNLISLAKDTGKTVIYGGTGNGPAFIERTADIAKAVKDIISSKIFDNGIAPSAEHSIVVEACISQKVKETLCTNGAYFLSEQEAGRLSGILFCSKGIRKARSVGLSATELAKRAEIRVPAATTVLVVERKYVSEADPYSKELLAPVLAYYIEDGWEHACEKCIELLLHERNAHTLVIHSNNEEVIRQFALKKPVGRMLVNTPAVFGGIGATTNLFPSMVLGSGSAGHGAISENVSPLNLIYIRKVGYGVRELSDMGHEILQKETICQGDVSCMAEKDTKAAQAIRQILLKAVASMNKSSNG